MPDTFKTARELMQSVDGHYAVPTKGNRWFIYMSAPAAGEDRMVATRSSDSAALLLIRQRRDAYAQADANARRECRAEVERLRTLLTSNASIPGAA